MNKKLAFVLIIIILSTIVITPGQFTKKAGAPEILQIALTFDDGPSEHTIQILETLAKYNAKATFCVLGIELAGREEIILAAANAGHQIVGHSWEHKQLKLATEEYIREDIRKTNEAIEKIIGTAPKFFRTPYGEFSPKIRRAMEEAGLVQVQWNVDTLDWKTLNSGSIYNMIMNNAENGAIMLSHDTIPATAAAMERAIPALINKGYELVTVEELLGETTAGRVYRSKGVEIK
ncbi:MAG: polysaccharide deacetylase family protein [Oscillospiraceae bacterium]|nr:polysaccharide deacetylase family protein [Oscillospiraceae bacterium]